MAQQFDSGGRLCRRQIMTHYKKLSRWLIILTVSFIGLFVSSVAVYIIVAAAEKQGDANLIEIEEKNNAIRPLEWTAPAADFALSAQSAVMIDCASGSILYEKSADELIPPASMTKLMTLYVTYKNIGNGSISLTDTVPLPPESWLCNLPPRSSGMLLEKGQRVTVLELMQGMAVASGNDAAIALAIYVAGSVKEFCHQMNAEAAYLGLSQTSFDDVSGLSEKNTTTARDFVKFCRVYVAEYPQSIATLHSIPSMTYPKPHNMPSDGSGTFYNITKQNTNRLLSLLDGCDGLKTGYIDESGYNLALTVKRGDLRIIAVIMGCPGNTTSEGDRNRIKDSTTLAEYAYKYFACVRLPKSDAVPIIVTGGKKQNGRYIFAVETCSPFFTIPAGTAGRITRTIYCPGNLQAPIEYGHIIGSVEYKAGNTKIASVPLIADRSIEQGGAIIQFYDYLYRLIAIRP